MRKFTLLFLVIFAQTKVNGQSYQISFVGTGASLTVDSVKVENLSQCTNTTISGSDTLFLSSTVGINTLINDTSFSIYPNPVTDNFFIEFNKNFKLPFGNL
ncbi:MAG: hypothetical protein Q8M15_14585 [Bacteroidota bacterium]|nr:hypothetical protein [Bacteroidota bacterium]